MRMFADDADDRRVTRTFFNQPPKGRRIRVAECLCQSLKRLQGHRNRSSFFQETFLQKKELSGRIIGLGFNDGVSGWAQFVLGIAKQVLLMPKRELVADLMRLGPTVLDPMEILID